MARQKRSRNRKVEKLSIKVNKKSALRSFCYGYNCLDGYTDLQNGKCWRSPATENMTAAEQSLFESYTLGAATFDLSGLPKEYYTLVDGSKSLTWVQPIFQALGLKSLLTASLPVENFTYAVIHGKDHTAIVIRQQSNYLALLTVPDRQAINERYLGWAQSFDATSLRNNPKFQVI